MNNERQLPSRMLIGGELRAAASGLTLPVIDPSDLSEIGTIPRAGAEDVDYAVAAAKAAFPAWGAMNVRERAGVLLDFGRVVTDHGEELAQLDSLDNGSPIRVMRGDVQMARDAVHYLTGLALEVRGETVASDHDRLNYTIKQPFGVVGRIIPFNHPLYFAISRIVAPLLMGNTIVLKPSEHTSLSALRLAELGREVFPAGVVNIVTGYGHEAGDRIVAHPDVPRLAFIGAAATGRAIQRRAAEVAIKAVTLELGGKNPLVVFPDADLDAVVDGIVRGMNFTWQGQSCGSTSRLLVHRSVHGAVVGKLVKRLESMRFGLPGDESADVAAIVNQAQYDKVQQYVEIGKREATLVWGGTRPAGSEFENGLFMRPAVFDGVKPGSRLEQEEIFGPVLSVITFDDYADAVRIANGVSYGLTASIWTKDLAVAHAFARDVEAGYVWVNDSSKHFLGTSFGGVKDSGLGREEGPEELESYAQSKNVNVRFE